MNALKLFIQSFYNGRFVRRKINKRNVVKPTASLIGYCGNTKNRDTPRRRVREILCSRIFFFLPLKNKIHERRQKRFELFVFFFLIHNTLVFFRFPIARIVSTHPKFVSRLCEYGTHPRARNAVTGYYPPSPFIHVSLRNTDYIYIYKYVHPCLARTTTLLHARITRFPLMSFKSSFPNYGNEVPAAALEPTSVRNTYAYIYIYIYSYTYTLATVYKRSRVPFQYFITQNRSFSRAAERERERERHKTYVRFLKHRRARHYNTICIYDILLHARWWYTFDTAYTVFRPDVFITLYSTRPLQYSIRSHKSGN